MEFDITNLNTDQLNLIGKAMDDEMNEEITKIQKELNLSEACAMDVLYLRQRSRWTPELELRLIQLHKSGTPPPNMMEFK